MMVALDVQYRQEAESNAAQVAAVLFEHWDDATPTRVVTKTVSPVAPYQSGAFYKRELPCLLAVINEITEPLECIVVDGYVYLDQHLKPGLGAHLHAALEGKVGLLTKTKSNAKEVAVIGVAKTVFEGAPSTPVLRGTSKQPLFVSSIGMDAQAAHDVQRMHGQHRIPTLLKLVDSLARGLV